MGSDVTIVTRVAILTLYRHRLMEMCMVMRRLVIRQQRAV